MRKLIAMGEALIDMIPMESGKQIKDVSAFSPAVGGAPANVCGAFAKLGGESYMITQIGEDPFGDKIMDNFDKFHIHTDYVMKTNQANTALAFVALKKNGEREFSFYRNPSADMLLNENQIKKEWFSDAFVFHFCSVALKDSPMKEAHKKAIEYALDSSCVVSFDPNLRFNLWKSKEDLKRTILEFIPYAHILKISEEELYFITGIKNEEEAIKNLFLGNVSMILYTKGKNGAVIYTKNKKITVEGIKVKAIDATGAGDAFIGSFLFQLSNKIIELKDIDYLDQDLLKKILIFSNKYAAKSVTRHGAIDSYPFWDDMYEI